MTMWLERADGFFFPRSEISAAVESKLQTLALDDAAQNSAEGTLLPFNKAVLLSDEDAELLSLPPRNPYQISIRTEGYIGAKNFRYVAEFLDANGRPLTKPEFNGAVLRVGDEKIFRLNADQFALVNLIRFGNENLSHEESLLKIRQIQRQAHAATAHVDKYIADKKIIMPDKLGVDFQDNGDTVKVAPVLLENRGGEFQPIAGADFQETFGKRKKVSGVYRGRDGAQYVFDETLRGGLKQIKSVGTLSKADAARYKLQPRELFDGEAFDFSYSDRVDGLTEFDGVTYQNVDGGIVSWTDEIFHAAPSVPREVVKRRELFVLKIKENFERVDYKVEREQRDAKTFADVLCPDVKLYDHQIQGVWRMSQLWQAGYRGVLVADDMGLGKTLQTLTFLGGLKKFDGLNSPVLIVAPTALLATWQTEYRKFLRGNIFDDVLPLHGLGLKKFLTDELTPNGKRKLSLRNLPPNVLALTTYETLRDYQFSFAEVPWSIIVVDEAQKIKNPDAGVTKALKAMKYEFAICLSGTPVENSWVDLWSIMDFAQPAHLGDLKTFRENFIVPLTGDAENIRQLGTELYRRLEPLILRRMKEDHLKNLPVKNIFTCREEMPTYQRKIYSAVLERYRRAGFVTPLNFINALREVSLHPDLATMSAEKFFTLDAQTVINRSARLIKTFDILREIKTRGEKVLIFVTSRKMQSILRRLLEKIFGFEILPPINGDMNGAARQRIIDKFKTLDGFNALILSAEAAGVGFTITEANNVIHLGRTWNPAKENQATDRVYRIGQKKSVNVYLPLAVSKNLRGKTFDENLEQLLSYKKNLSANILFPTAETSADVNTLIALMNLQVDEPAYWTIDAVDDVTGVAFEQIVTDLYCGMKNFTAEQTPVTNDYGADVVVKSVVDNTGLLIQCKHRDNPAASIGKDAVQEISAAVAYYADMHKRTFQPVVVTNAENFTAGAVALADKNGVSLIARRELAEMFRAHKILRATSGDV